MALLRTDSDPTVVDRVPSARPMTPATAIATAHAHLQAMGEAATVVLEAGRPVGVVTAAGLAGAVTTHGPDAPIAAVMDYVAVPVDPQGDAYDTVRASGARHGTGSSTAKREGRPMSPSNPQPATHDRNRRNRPRHARSVLVDSRPRNNRRAVDWALPDTEVGPVDVVRRVGDTDVQSGDSYCAHCPVCHNHQRMQSAVTTSGERYDRCLGCGLLWHVDRELGLVVGARLTTPR